MYDRIVKGGIIVLDEYACEKWTESNAVDRFLKEHNYAQTGLDKSTSILITDDLNSSSSKMAKARKLGIEIMTYDQVLKAIKFN